VVVQKGPEKEKKNRHIKADPKLPGKIRTAKDIKTTGYLFEFGRAL